MNQSLKPSVLSALVLAFSGFGDSFLYVVLPVYALQLNVPVVWVGFLLSINRFVRLVANHLLAFLFNRFEAKRITILAAFLAMLSTFVYGMAPGIVIWIVARVIWGFCYSALRINAASYSLEYCRNGLSLGVSSGLQELGPVIALVAGPLLLDATNLSTTFYILSATSIAAIVIAFYLPPIKQAGHNYSFSLDIIPSTFNLLTFLLSFFVQGILIVSLSKLIAEPGITVIHLAALAGFYLAYKRICSITISPFAGMLADKWGIDKVYLIALFFTITGLLLIATGLIQTGIITTFTFYGILNALSPGNAVAGATNHLKAVASNNTWSDLGAATGVLVAGSFLEFTSFSGTFFLATFILLFVCIIYSKPILLKTKSY
jgi:MFS transporter, DHA1 family, multidrug resistance protein